MLYLLSQEISQWVNTRGTPCIHNTHTSIIETHIITLDFVHHYKLNYIVRTLYIYNYKFIIIKKKMFIYYLEI